VTLPQPTVTGLAPIRREVGSSFTLSISGAFLAGATQVAFIPADGISVANPPTVSSDGAVATVGVNVSATAPTISRVVTITAPGGTTTSTPSVANTFTVTAVAGTTFTPILSVPVGVRVATAPPPTSVQIGYGPVLSPAVGVIVVPPPPPTTVDNPYGPIASRPVGVLVGSAIYSMTPTRMEPGTTALVTFTGIGLDQVTGLTVAPVDGVTAGTPTVSADGLSMTVQVVADGTAVRGSRMLVPMTATGPVSVPQSWTNVLYVGLRPEIISITPILQTVGNTFTLTVIGTRFDSATTVRFEPPDGILVMNPPTINAAGTQATVTVIIDGMAPGGQRVVVVDGPYGPSDSTSGANNTFTVSRPVVSAPSSSRMAGATSREPPAETVAGYPDTTGVLALVDRVMPGIPVWRQDTKLLPASEPLPAPEEAPDRGIYPLARNDDREPLLLAAMTTHGYRGPPADSAF
jgi:hypothetical protein